MNFQMKIHEHLIQVHENPWEFHEIWDFIFWYSRNDGVALICSTLFLQVARSSKVPAMPVRLRQSFLSATSGDDCRCEWTLSVVTAFAFLQHISTIPSKDGYYKHPARERRNSSCGRVGSCLRCRWRLVEPSVPRTVANDNTSWVSW